MTRHASAETLARFRGGSLRRAATRRVRAHLDSCARCTATYAALGEIPGLLAATEVPPMPAHLTARIETALATESAHRAAGSPSGSPARPAHGGRPRPGHALRSGRGRSWPRLPAPALRVAAATAAVVVVGGGAVAVAQLGGSGGAASSSGSAAGGSAAGEPARAAAPSGLVRPGARTPVQTGPVVRYQAGGQTAAIRPVQTATNYQPAHLTRQVTATLAQVRNKPTMTPEVGLPHSDQQTGSGQLARLSGCLSRVADGQPVRLVDLAQFRGSAATIIVTAATRAHAAQVWVVGPGCSRSASDVLEHQRLSG